MDSQTSFLKEAPPTDSCTNCRHFSGFKEPRKSEEEWVIYGYCFKAGMRVHSPNMGKGYPVYIDGGKCKEWKKKLQFEKLVGGKYGNERISR
jgi:hypothetical protein